jgi:NTE family protein
MTERRVRAGNRGNETKAMPERNETKALVLQGGGALGAYQAGAYEALAAQDYTPDWIAGISIGAINGALIAGNEPHNRIDRLHGFWDLVSSSFTGWPFVPGTAARADFNEFSGAVVATVGVPGFFTPRFPPAALMPAGGPRATSHYDTEPLRATLRELVDFDYLNDGAIRLSLGAVNVATGNFAYFDSKDTEIGPEHIMASGALPPGFPAVMIEGEHYWDGGLVSNSPLQYVFDERNHTADLCVFQVDLFCARGRLPQTLWDVGERKKDIRYSSRTRLNTDMMARLHDMRNAARRLAKKLPPKYRDDPDLAMLMDDGAETAVTIVHLIHTAEAYETQAKDYDFSALSVTEHWDAGRSDAERTLDLERWKQHRRVGGAVLVIDVKDPRKR